MGTTTKKKTGYTLIELLVATTIFAIVIVVAFASFASVSGTETFTTSQREVTQQARAVLDQLSQDVQLADHEYGIINRVLNPDSSPGFQLDGTLTLPPEDNPLSVLEDDDRRILFLNGPTNKLTVRLLTKDYLGGYLEAKGNTPIATERWEKKYYREVDSNGLGRIKVDLFQNEPPAYASGIFVTSPQVNVPENGFVVEMFKPQSGNNVQSYVTVKLTLENAAPAGLINQRKVSSTFQTTITTRDNNFRDYP